MYIIDHINPAPKWVAPAPKEVFRTDLERQRYWEEEKRRWREGYGDGESHLVGMHYFHLTQGWIKDGSDGTLIRPKYRDCDEWMINPIHESFWNLQRHELILKRREIGGTVIGAGLLPSYTMRMFPASTFGMTSCDKDRIYKAYSDKTDVYVKNLDQDIRPILDKTIGFRENATKQQVYLKLPLKAKDMNGEDSLQNFEFFSKETTESDKAAAGFSGTRLRAVFIDELPLHIRKKILLQSLQPALMKSANQSGLMLALGTLEASITPEQIAEIKSLVLNSEVYKFNVTFAPAWWGLFMNENGVSDEQKGIDWVMSERERLDKSDDKSFLKAFMKNYPLTLDEILDMGGGTRFDEYTVEQIKGQLKELPKNNEHKFIPHTLYVTTKDVIATPDSDGKIEILEQPKKDVKYIIGVDGIMTSQLSSASESGVSKFSAKVTKGIDPQSNLQFAVVAKYTERPRSIEDANLTTIKLLKHYNKYQNAYIIGELNAGGEHLLKMIMNEGLSSCIINRRDLSNKKYVETKKPWFYRNVNIMEWQNEAANIYFKKYSHMVFDKDLLEDALLPQDDNTDHLDAFMACLYGWGTGDLLEEKSHRIKTKPVKMLRYKYINGVLTPEWYTKNISHP